MKRRVRSRPASRLSACPISRSESGWHGAANASPTPSVVTVSRSLRSWMNHDSAKASTAIPAAARNTVSSASVKACR